MLAGGRPYAWAVAAFYAWLRRHPGLVDGVPAVALAFLGLGQAIALFRYSLVPVLLALVIALAFRRRYPVAAFITGIVVGLVQILVGIRPNATDLAIVILLYTLAAYRRGGSRSPGWPSAWSGSAVAVAPVDAGASSAYWTDSGRLDHVRRAVADRLGVR